MGSGGNATISNVDDHRRLHEIERDHVATHSADRDPVSHIEDPAAENDEVRRERG